MNTLQENPTITEKIYQIRGVSVMIDKDLALLYGVQTKQLNRAVKRNIERFPEDFMFQLTKEECLRCQFGTLNTEQGQHLKYMPYAFTEYGIAMLSGILRSETAIAANIRIMRAFADMRKLIRHTPEVFNRIETLEYHHLQMKQQLDETTNKVDMILDKLNSGPEVQMKQGVFYDGQTYDAYTFIADLIRKATRRIVLIDNYIDDTVLTIMAKRGERVEATIYTGKMSKQLRLDMEKHNSQYPAIDIKIFSKAHDRFLIIDDKLYHIGASIKDLGKKWFAFTLMKDISPDDILQKI